jgi:hypothetical protein
LRFSFFFSFCPYLCISFCLGFCLGFRLGLCLCLFINGLSSLLGGDSFNLRKQLAFGTGYGSGSCSTRSLNLRIFMLDTLAKQNLRDRIARYCSFTKPIFYALAVEHDLPGGVFFNWVVMAQLFKYFTVTRRA